jgi:8-oxo-dGTP pyrophosphatase MutT (NUDIX family)
MTVERAPQSAGGVVLRRDDSGEVEVLLVLQRGEWRLPKGMREQGETLPITAYREVLEESGVHAAVVDELGRASWTYVYQGVDCVETCTYFWMVDIGRPHGDHDEETERVAWLRPGDAATALTYPAEQDMVRLVDGSCDVIQHDVVIGGESTGILAATGRLALDRDSARMLLDSGERVVLVLPSFSPRDAALVSETVAVASVREGPSSHVAVVAAALSVPCLTRLRAEIVEPALHDLQGVLIPAGSPVELDEGSGTLRLLTPIQWATASTERIAPRDSTSPAAAFEWANRLAGDMGASPPLNWKLFKRDLLRRYFPTPETSRFPSPWAVEQVVAQALALADEGTVRGSAFPRDIACHAVSIRLNTSDVGQLAAEIAGFDPAADLEIFVEQSPSNLAWRLVWNHGRFTMEAGIGQAMYLFEEERGEHPLASASWETHQERVSAGGEALPADHLVAFLERHRGDLVERCHRIADELRIDVFAVEGYFHLVGETYVAVDMDLPFDWVFMSQGPG